MDIILPDFSAMERGYLNPTTCSDFGYKKEFTAPSY